MNLLSKIVGRMVGTGARTPPNVPDAPPAAPQSEGKRLLDLPPGDCRFPLGPFPHTFCGQPKANSTSYCAHHASICIVRDKK